MTLREELQEELGKFDECIYLLNWAIIFGIVSIICNLFVFIGLFKNHHSQMFISWVLGMISLFISIKLKNKSDKVL